MPFYLGGFSLGGVIATILALENDDIDGLFLFAPVYYSSKVGLLRWAPLISYVKPWVFCGISLTSPERRLVLYGREESQPGEHEIIHPSRYPELRILNQSHMGMMLSPQNALFGTKGNQLVCNGNKWKVFSACLFYAGGTRWRGAEGTESPDGVPVARTTYNPDFESVMALHDQVFAAPALP